VADDENEYARAEKSDRMAQAAKLIQENRTGLVLTGRVVNGRVELDQAALDEIQEKFPNANVSFVAVNAPFDPESQLV